MTQHYVNPRQGRNITVTYQHAAPTLLCPYTKLASLGGCSDVYAPSPLQ
jgi:hypothetical protein